jgi:hypothetical protein
VSVCLLLVHVVASAQPRSERCNQAHKR